MFCSVFKESRNYIVVQLSWFIVNISTVARWVSSQKKERVVYFSGYIVMLHCHVDSGKKASALYDEVFFYSS